MNSLTAHGKARPARVFIPALLFQIAFCAGFASSQHVEARRLDGSRAGATKPADVALGALRYRCVGPTRGGRVTAVCGVRRQPGVLYMGATGGGVWKTKDFGRSWRNVSDGFFDSPSIGALRSAPSEPKVVWCGTGSDGIRSNVIAGCGVYLSRDAGKTWKHVGLPKTGHIGAVEVHPEDANTAFVAAIGNAFAPNEERRLYRTRDGGETWERVLFVSDRCGAVDVEFHPKDPKVLYASTWTCERKPWTIISGGREGGIYRSRDGGDTWTKLSAGLPAGLIGKIDLAVTAADSARVYALVEAPGDAGGVYVSIDEGTTWVQSSKDRNVRNRPFYYTNIDACPKDPDRVFVSAKDFLMSTDRGKTWKRRSTPHGDHHDLWIHPDDPKQWIQGNDGGACVTLDDGATWSSIRNQATAELYQVAVDTQFPYRLYAGQQDNTTICVPSLPPYRAPGGASAFWEAVGGCETGPAIPHPSKPWLVYSCCKGRFGVYDRRTGQEARFDVGAANMYGHDPKDLRFRFQRVSPIHLSPHNPSVLYHCSQFVHRSTNGGLEWTRISPDLTAFDTETQGISGQPITRDITGEEFHSCLYAIRESPLAAGVIWVGSADGPIHVTRDAGANWKNVTPPALGPHGRVQCVEASPHAAGKAYACVLRYMLGDARPHVYRTRDYGATWTLLTGPDSGIPQGSPARVLREDPKRTGLLYLGTENGMYVSFDDGAQWSSLQLNLPVTPITDVVVHDGPHAIGDLVLSTMGRSFWILDDLSPLRQWSAAKRDDAVTLFRPRIAYRTRVLASRSLPSYPAAGAHIDFVVRTKKALTLEILDASGRLVRRFAQTAPKRVRELEETRMGMRTRPRVEATLPTGMGHKRFIWDLRHAGTGRLIAARGSRRGPHVAPGTYTAVLRVASKEAAQRVDFEVRIDPRVRAAGVTDEDLRILEKAQLRVRDGLRACARLVRSLDKKIKAAGTDAAKAALRAKRAEIVTRADQVYPQPMLFDQWVYLAGVLAGGDRRPGRDALDRLEELESELRELAREGD